MARLSDEHHRATASVATPNSARTSGRFRGIFKPRRSTSAGSPNTLTKSPPAVTMSEDASQGDHESLHPSTEERAGEAEGASAGFGHVPSTEPFVVHQLSTDFKLSAEAEVESVGGLSASTPVQCKSLLVLQLSITFILTFQVTSSPSQMLAVIRSLSLPTFSTTKTRLVLVSASMSRARLLKHSIIIRVTALFALH
jgi:hypothetical protein